MNYQITLDNFEGPFDLLLHLVKEMKMDIYAIDTRVIIEEYLKYIHSLQELNIDIASEFLVMAASLLHLKSKMLIGKSLENTEEEESEFSIASEEALQEKLIAYQAYKDICEEFKVLEDKRGQVFTKVPENLKEYQVPEKMVNSGDVTIDDLLLAFANLQERLHFKEPIVTKITKREISVESRKQRIWHVIEAKKRCEFTELFEVINREMVVVTFLALLEMMKSQEIVVKQENNFEKIWIERGCMA